MSDTSSPVRPRVRFARMRGGPGESASPAARIAPGTSPTPTPSNAPWRRNSRRSMPSPVRSAIAPRLRQPAGLSTGRLRAPLGAQAPLRQTEDDQIDDEAEREDEDHH